MKMKDIVKGKVYIHSYPGGGIARYRVKDILHIPSYSNTKGKYNQKQPKMTVKTIIQLVCLRDGSMRGVNGVKGFICLDE